MKTLILFLMIALGVAGILFCRVNLDMSWDDMSAGIETLLPRVLAIGIVVVGMAATLIYVACSGRSK